MKIENSFEVAASPEAAWALLMDVARVVPDDDRPYTDRTVSDLMGKEPEARFKFIMEEAYTAKDIDI